MLNQGRWEEARRLYFQERWRVAAITRQLEVDRKTVRRCVRETVWQPYRRTLRQETVLSEHAVWLRQRAPQVRYSAQILYQELCAQRGYRGSYETVKLFVRPLREAADLSAQTQVRFETAPVRRIMPMEQRKGGGGNPAQTLAKATCAGPPTA